MVETELVSSGSSGRISSRGLPGAVTDTSLRRANERIGFIGEFREMLRQLNQPPAVRLEPGKNRFGKKRGGRREDREAAKVSVAEGHVRIQAISFFVY